MQDDVVDFAGIRKYNNFNLITYDYHHSLDCRFNLLQQQIVAYYVPRKIKDILFLILHHCLDYGIKNSKFFLSEREKN